MKIGEFEVNVTSSKCPMPQFSITIEAKAPRSLKGIIEVLAIKYPPSKAIYFKEQRSVTLRIFNRMIGIYENGLVTFCAENLDDARKVLKKVKEIIDEARIIASTIGSPSVEEVEKWNKLNTLELYNYLPKINCGECGEATCMALAAKILSGERKLTDCPLLQREEYRKLINKFREKYGDKIFAILS
ncbi:MAG: hypothetical protein J7K82_00380 [Thermoproteales archaeon]|nr:hypothetical protein [Thermoproteales archaeon]